MTTATMFEFEYGGARIQLPPNVIVQNFLDSLQQQPLELTAFESASTITPPAIGTFWYGQGGIYAGTMRGEKGPDYHLIVAHSADGFTKDAAWGSQGKTEDGAQSDCDGLKNTFALYQSKHSHPAAEWANDLKIEGHEDWYLPARRELRLCWVNVPELFEDGWYWSSTQYSATSAWCQVFVDGGQYGLDKDYGGRARAVRRLLVIQ